MIRQVCAVRDGATGLFGMPFFVPAIGAAIRSFSDEANRAAADNPVYAHSEDFTLHVLAEYDDETGTFVTAPDMPRELVRGKDVKRPSE